MSVRSTLVAVVAVISVLTGLVALPIHANNDLLFNWVRNLNGTAWGYTQAEDPSDYGSEGLVERFELRMGDCDRNEHEDDCKSSQERIELVELDRPAVPLNGEVWYRWKMYFPEGYKNIYPAKTHHIRFVEKGDKLVWSFEIGSTGVLWLGSYVSDEHAYYPLIDEDELLSQWHELSVHAKWGSDSGFFRVWVNNLQKVNYVGTTCRGCRLRLGYGIMRSGLDHYYKSNPGNDLPTQVIYYVGFERSASGIEYPGYVPPQTTHTPTVSEQPKTLKPVLIIETTSKKTSGIDQLELDKGDAEVPNRDRD